MLARGSRILAPMIRTFNILGACKSNFPAEPDEMTRQLNWFQAAGVAGFCAVEEKSFYADKNRGMNLDVGGRSYSMRGV